MFEVGFQELVLLFIIGLLILGPERLPKVATQIGRWVGRARRTASQLKYQLEREIALSELEETRKRKGPTPIKPSVPAAPPAPPQNEGAASPEQPKDPPASG